MEHTVQNLQDNKAAMTAVTAAIKHK